MNVHVRRGLHVSIAASAMFTLRSDDAVALHVASENQYTVRSILEMSRSALQRVEKRLPFLWVVVRCVRVGYLLCLARNLFIKIIAPPFSLAAYSYKICKAETRGNEIENCSNSHSAGMGCRHSFRNFVWICNILCTLMSFWNLVFVRGVLIGLHTAH